ncbi:MAG: growth inhibitor PemK [Caulobacter sp.]|nr:growth inhibitor PemK [Caulobacter sp.]
MKKPEPQVGLVIRYDFLWSHERERGFEGGVKDRPCVIVTAIVRGAGGLTEVLLAPITHSPPREGAVAIAIPPRVGRHLGLDEERSFIIADESNSVAWEDAGIVPAEPGKRWAYGRIPQALYEQLRAAMLDLHSKRKLRIGRRS